LLTLALGLLPACDLLNVVYEPADLLLLSDGGCGDCYGTVVTEEYVEATYVSEVVVAQPIEEIYVAQDYGDAWYAESYDEYWFDETAYADNGYYGPGAEAGYDGMYDDSYSNDGADGSYGNDGNDYDPYDYGDD
jgi:hypothetical protein